MKHIKLSNGKLGVELEKIDSPELAYILGYICADCSVSDKNVEFECKLADREILDFISTILRFKVSESLYLNKATRRFPRVRATKHIKDIIKFIKEYKKEGRNLPIVGSNLTRYLVLGFFDGDGCITWGRRKDRNRIWQKVSFTSSLSMLITLQKILSKEVGISTLVRPKRNEQCFVLEFSNKEDVIKFGNWLYLDKEFIVLKRKFDNFTSLRLELGEFGETVLNTIPSRASGQLEEGVETSGESNGLS